ALIRLPVELPRTFNDPGFEHPALESAPSEPRRTTTLVAILDMLRQLQTQRR
ncbi:unnamed protein product, partial [Polarella glacialis]